MTVLALALCAFTQAVSTPTVQAPAADPHDPPTVRIVVLGDDWATGPRGARDGWPVGLAGRLESRFDGVRFEVENLARGGETTTVGLRRLARDVLARDPDVVVLHYGFADSCVDLPANGDFPRVAPGAFRSNLRDLAAAAASGDADVLLVQHGARLWTAETRAAYGRAPFDTADPLGFDRLGAAYAGLVLEVANDTGARTVATHAADLARGVQATERLRTDGRLPNVSGRSWIAERAADALTEMLERRTLRRLSGHTAPSRGWTLHELDLAGDAGRPIEVDRDPNQYLGHPSTVRIPREGGGATVLCAYPEGHGRGPIVLKRSDDGGATWSERLETPSTWATSKETPVFLRIPRADGSGHNLVLFSGLFPARRALSYDDGATWTELEEPSPGGAPWGGIVVVGDHALLGPGRALAWFHDDGRYLRAERGPRRFTVFQIETSDGGVTWSQPRAILSDARADWCEPGFLRIGPGVVPGEERLVRQGDRLALLLRENSRRRNSGFIVSDDLGRTWSAPREVAGALTGDRHQARALGGGRVFVSFRDTGLASRRSGDWVGWIGTLDDVLEGRQGERRLRLMDNLVRADCAYPALTPLSGGGVLAVTYGHWSEGAPPWIAALRLTPSELGPLAPGARSPRAEGVNAR
ncbi:MAG: GDSL-type esterase/lipase family protein [Planctomycetota bacterium]